MNTYTIAQLNCILEKHAKWTRSESGGRRAYLRGADLQGADLQGADLRGADLQGADLRDADLQGADLQGADLRDADLRGAYLRGAYLQGADLRDAKNLSDLQQAKLSIVPECGAFEAWKKCQGGVLVRLLIPDKAKRSNATGRKCRADFVKVLEVVGAKEGVSIHNGTTTYVKGKTVKADQWCEDRWRECAGGIHFFITRAEAEDYN